MDTHGDPAAELQRVLAVARGERVSESGAALTKAVSLMLGAAGGDIELTAAGFSRQRSGQRSGPGWADAYWPSLAAGTLQLMLRLGGVRSWRGAPAVGRYDPSPTSRPKLYARREPRWLWFSSDEAAVRIAVRPADAPGLPSGPPEPILAWAPATKRHLTFASPLSCPHCKASHLTLRIVDVSLTCSACGGSFRPGPAVLALGVGAQP